MRRAYSYINLLVYCSIFLILLGLILSVFYPLINKSFQALTVLKQEQEISRVMDLIAEDLRFAEQVIKTGKVLIYRRQNTVYEYLLKNNRLTRKKEGFLYLTAKEYVIEDFSVNEAETGLFNIIVKFNNNVLQRIIKRRN